MFKGRVNVTRVSWKKRKKQQRGKTEREREETMYHLEELKPRRKRERPILMMVLAWLVATLAAVIG